MLDEIDLKLFHVRLLNTFNDFGFVNPYTVEQGQNLIIDDLIDNCAAEILFVVVHGQD